MKLTAMKTAIIAAGMSTVLPAMAGTVTSDGADLVIKTKGGLSVATADKDYSVQLGGRIQYDYDLTEFDSATKTDDFFVRRARLYVKGNVAGDWSYKAQFNILNGGEVEDTALGTGGEAADEGGTPEDLYIRYNGFGKKAVVTAGRQKMPFGLEALTSSKDISMLERSAVTEAYAVGRAEGVQLSGSGANYTYAVAVYEGDTGSQPSGDSSYAARATFAPVRSDDLIVHLGVAFKDEGDDVEALGLEAAAVAGPFHAQAEFVDAEAGATSTDAYYVQAGWVITGEQRPYKGGKFKRVKPASDSGALELLVRYEDGEAKYSDIGISGTTTDASSYGIGLNWYVNNNVKLGMSYMDGETEGAGSVDGQEFRTRIQLTF